MVVDPLQALQAASRHAPPAADTRGTLLIAGATGMLGHEVVRRLAGAHRFAHTVVLAREPIRDGMRGIESLVLPADRLSDIAHWPQVAVDTALVLFDPPRLYYERERALWAPEPEQLPALARWLHACGARTLAVVQPHAQATLPEALKRGLANLDEQAVAALGFERVLLVRSAQKPKDARLTHPAERLAAWMLSIIRFMVPASEQPVRAAKVAELHDLALAIAPPCVHVAPPEMVWQAAQGELRAVATGWLRPSV